MTPDILRNYIPITKTRYAEFCERVKKDLPEDAVALVIKEFTTTANYDPEWSRSTTDPDFWKRAYARKLENAKAQGLTYSQVYVARKGSPGVKKSKK
jgi:hypothetical protein